MAESRSYRFGDANRPGLLLGMAAHQALAVIAGIVALAAVLQTSLPPPVGLLGPIAGFGVAFGRWRGVPLAETMLPAGRLLARRAIRRGTWVRVPLVGDNTGGGLPAALRRLELVAVDGSAVGVVRDLGAGTVTAAARVRGDGFPLAAATEQDGMLAGWGAALSPLARDGSPVRHVVWQEWAHPVASDTHQAFLTSIGVFDRAADTAVGDYLELVDAQAPHSIAHDVFVTVTVDERRVRARRAGSRRRDAAVDAVIDEMRQLARRLGAAGLEMDPPLDTVQLAAAVRVRSDPSRAAQVTATARSLAAAAGRGALEWGPMAVEAGWGHCRVDGAHHRSYRIAGWPRLPVGGDWLAGLLTDTHCTRTVTVVMEPVPIGRAARAADREVMAREADSELKQRKGFRVNARERKRLADAERRERELSEGHAEFGFVGFVDIAAVTVDDLGEHCAAVEQAAAQCLLDLRPLDARHDRGWVASLPLGRALTPRRTP